MGPSWRSSSKKRVTTHSANLSELNTLRYDFPLFDTAGTHFLDSAASSQKPGTVIEAMSEFMAHGYANVNRGAYRLSLHATERYEEARVRAARFIGSPSAEQVVLTRGTTTGLNQIASGWGGSHLRPGDRILLTIMEHHANLVPWQMVAKRTGARLDFIPVTDDFRLDMDAFEAKLGPDLAVVSVTGMSNVLGTMPPLERIIAGARSVDALVVVDGAQLVPHNPVDVSSLDPDFLVFSAHKMLGPTGIGVLWGRPERLEEMEPFEGGGDMISEVGLESSTWTTVPHRFEAGTPPIVEAVGLTAAIDYLEAVGMDRVMAHDRMLTSYCLERLSEIQGVSVHGPTDLEARGGVVSFTLGDAHPHDLATILDETGVAIRAGHHCAKPLNRRLGVPATARASFYVYNTTDDIDALTAGLRHAAKLFS